MSMTGRVAETAIEFYDRIVAARSQLVSCYCYIVVATVIVFRARGIVSALFFVVAKI